MSTTLLTDELVARIEAKFLLNENEAMLFLGGISQKHIYNLRRKGLLSYCRLGHRIMYRPESLRQFARAKEELATAIESTTFEKPTCPVFQNVTAFASSDVTTIKNHLIDQLTSPVRWTQSVQNMVKDGATTFIECGPGKILQGLVRKIHPESEVSGI